MAFDIQNETLIPFKDVPKWCRLHLKNNVHPSTIYRWRLRGIRGIKLETVLAGGKRYTSAEALQRFFTNSTLAADGKKLIDNLNHQAITPNQAEAYLNSEGF